jgi:hypothetical protein
MSEAVLHFLRRFHTHSSIVQLADSVCHSRAEHAVLLNLPRGRRDTAAPKGVTKI